MAGRLPAPLRGPIGLPLLGAVSPGTGGGQAGGAERALAADEPDVHPSRRNTPSIPEEFLKAVTADRPLKNNMAPPRDTTAGNPDLAVRSQLSTLTALLLSFSPSGWAW
ncbi:hypothetical protein ACWGCW_34955 [Streptomyces sp. NPDC054933]